MKRIFTTNKIKQIYLIVISFLIFTGCDSNPDKKVVEEYLQLTYLNNDGKNAYQLLSSDDKKYKSEIEFVKETKKKNILSDNILEKYKDQFFYEIIETKNAGDTSIVKVNLTRPDADHVLQEMVSFAMVTAFTKQSSEERNEVMEKKFAELLKSKELQTVTEEKEFKVIKENEEYKLFLNLGLPQKLQRLREELEKLNSYAEEELRLINFEDALKIYRRMMSLQFSEHINSKIKEIEKIRKNTVCLGENICLGNTRFTPKSVEVKRVNISKINWYGGPSREELSNEEYFVLTYQIKNTSEGQVFSHEDENKYKTESQVFDNFGNIMNEFELNYDMENAEGKSYKKLAPGETRETKSICEAPLSKTAGEFLWKIKLYTDNRKTVQHVYVNFNRPDFNDLNQSSQIADRIK
jgi:hypothetical protein